jgi:hypothetical protein
MTLKIRGDPLFDGRGSDGRSIATGATGLAAFDQTRVFWYNLPVPGGIMDFLYRFPEVLWTFV